MKQHLCTFLQKCLYYFFVCQSGRCSDVRGQSTYVLPSINPTIWTIVHATIQIASALIKLSAVFTFPGCWSTTTAVSTIYFRLIDIYLCNYSSLLSHVLLDWSSCSRRVCSESPGRLVSLLARPMVIDSKIHNSNSAVSSTLCPSAPAQILH